MNRFRTKKRGKEEPAPRPSQDSESSAPFRPFRKGKKHQEAEKVVELDLSQALPSNDDFRTSLLMSGLSARFSMLREQDDPNTKIGKASDDSVLYPKRQSRLDYAALRELGDIAEVESIKATAPFAQTDSYHSDDAESMGGSIMSRAKPTEGNNLFGGRQKIYKIPVGTSSAKGSAGMGGRALYEDDVAMSAFQKWRQAEKERTSSDEEEEETREEAREEARAEAANRLSGNQDTDSSRVESPFLSAWNRKRETSSTTSSVPSLARNSTAATSVTSSHPAASVRDSQPNSTVINNTTIPAERSVTRTRRLYETGLNKDLQEQQSSALSRFETLSRQRALGTRTPDLAQGSNSPTVAAFKDRFSGDRKVLAKASAPNLRSISPTATVSSAGTPDLGLRAPSRTEGRTGFGGAPPLSPPVSESDDASILPIQPNDRGKATALGVFQKPSQPYDESRYAQRQIQLQQGRETPTQRHRPESNDSWADNRSRPTSSQRQTSEPRNDSSFTTTEPPLKEETAASSFLLGADDDSETSPAVSPKPTSPKLVVRRPSIRQHPALRDSAMPTPLSPSKVSGPPSPTEETSPSFAPHPKGVSPVDSPTLGPTSGLSGMVRQHLRAGSNASSIYGSVPLTADLESRFPADPDDANNRDRTTIKSNPWDAQGPDWTDLETAESIIDDGQSAIISPNTTDRDEFSSQLADGARRIREKMTSYVETDSRPTSPNATESKGPLDVPPRAGARNILRSKSSRGSLAERGRDESQSKAMKMLGISSRGFSPVGPRAQANSPAVFSPPRRAETSPGNVTGRSDPDGPADNGSEGHAGLRAFRQARRDLQRLREQETEARHHNQTQGPQGPLPEIPAPGQATPGFPQPRAPVEGLVQDRSRSGSRAASHEDRNRSGSESSNGGHQSPARYRKFSTSREGQQLAPSVAPRPQLRSPGLPGTDIKNSPIMPPQARRNASPAKLRTNLGNNDGLHARYPHGQPSPISPIPSPLSGSGRSTPLGAGPIRRPSVDAMGTSGSSFGDGSRRRLNPKDISEPTLVASSSHVPAVTLPPHSAPPHSAPPLPPMHPRRRPAGSRNHSDEAEKPTGDGVPQNFERRRPANIDTSPMHARGQGNNSPITVGPSASRMVASTPRSNMMPGGMI